MYQCISYKAFFLLYVCVFLGGYCSDFNQLELTVLSSGVRLYISHCVVLHNDPQWRTLTRLQDGGGLQLTPEIYSPLSALHSIRGHPGMFLSEQRSDRNLLRVLKRDRVCRHLNCHYFLCNLTHKGGFLSHVFYVS